MHICIFQTGEPLHIDDGNYRPMRAMLLADKLLENGYKVTIISSSFFHQRKTFRSNGFKTVFPKKNLTINLIPSCGYRKHIGFKRLIDHILLAINLNKFLQKNTNFKPDKIFLGYPPIEAALVVVRWARKKNIPVMLDIKDNWPENFIEPFPKYFKSVARIIFLPYFLISKYIFNNVNMICSITNSFISWIKQYNKKNSEINYFLAPLVRKKITLNEKQISKVINYWSSKGVNIIHGKHFAFVGSFTKSFDFKFIYELANIFMTKYPSYRLIICGTGERDKELNFLFKKLPNVLLTNEIDKYQASLLIKTSIATFAPYISSLNYINSIPNKVIESLENGIPFITNTEGELKKLIENFDNGIYLDKNMKNFYKIKKLIEEKEYREKLRLNSINSYQELFDFDNTYQEIIINLKGI